jgi:HK97 family phage prohead protease
MQVKTCPATIKAAGAHEGTDEGIVEAIVAAYNVDSVGDRIIPGAFAKTLARRKESGTVIPFVWSHKSDDPDYHIGEVLEAEERPEGLWVKARIDLDEPKAAKAYRLIKGRRIANYSFAYDEVDARPATKSDDGAKQDLFELELHECGPTMIGANRQTSTVAVKSRDGRGPLRKGHGMTARDLRTALDTAVARAVGGANRYVWVGDYTDDWVVFSVDIEGGPSSGQTGLYRQEYTVADGVVTLLGTPIEVVERTEYAPAKDGETDTKTNDTAAAIKAGRVLSKQNETRVAEIARLASELLSSVQAESHGDGEPDVESNAQKATPSEPGAAPESQVADEAAPESKSDVPAKSGTASERLRTEFELLELDLHTL